MLQLLFRELPAWQHWLKPKIAEVLAHSSVPKLCCFHLGLAAGTISSTGHNKQVCHTVIG